MKRLLVLAIVVVALAAGLVWAGRYDLGPVVVTREGEQKLILLFDDARRVTRPGWALRIPLLEETETYDARLLYLNISPELIHTFDQERIVVDNYVMWRIADPEAFLSSFRSGGTMQAETQIDRVVRAVVREVIGQSTLPDVLTEEREEIMRKITSRTNESLPDMGIRIEDVRINRTELPPGTEASVYARMKTERERLAKKYRAEGEEKARRIRAEADREARVIVAKARGEADVARGKGDAEATRIFAEAYGRDPEFFSFVRSLEAYRKTIGEGTTLVLSPKAEFFRFFQQSTPAGETDGGEAP